MPGVNDYRNIRFHPYNIMLILLLAGLSMIFVAVSGAYLYTRYTSGAVPINIPTIFLFNTWILIGSSLTMRRAKHHYENDSTLGYQQMLLATLVLSLLFMGLQFVGWGHLLRDNPNLTVSNMAAYIYAVSVLHFIHIVGGIPFLFIFTYVAYLRMKEPVSVFVYFSDPLKRLKLRLLTLYWHFLDILWVYIVLFFYLNYLFS